MKKAPTIYSRLLGGNRTDGGGEDIIVYTTDKGTEGPEFHFSQKFQRGVAFAGIKNLPDGRPDIAAALASPGMEVTFKEGIQFVSDGIMPKPMARDLLGELMAGLAEMAGVGPPNLAGLFDLPPKKKEDEPQRFEPSGPDGPVVYVHGNPPPEVIEKLTEMFKDPKFVADLKKRREECDHSPIPVPKDRPLN